MRSSDSRSRYISGICLLIALAFLARSMGFTDCDNLSKCNSSSEAVCALDKDKVCFRQFDNECQMKATFCESPQEYLIYDMKYCELINFMCNNEYKAYNDEYVKNENVDKVVYSIYSTNT